MKAEVSVLVPTYRAAGFLERTLESLRSQTVEFDLHISHDDGSSDSQKNIRYLNDLTQKYGAKQVYHQTRQLGWVQNMNWLLSRVETPFFMIMPHDDELAPAYLKTMLTALKLNPKAISAHSDLVWVLPDEQVGIDSSTSIKGDLATRVEKMIRWHFIGFVQRALIRTPQNLKDLYLIENPWFNFACDTLWTLQLALLGEVLHIKQPLYRKHTLKTLHTRPCLGTMTEHFAKPGSSIICTLPNWLRLALMGHFHLKSHLLYK